jgi:hypothetical protein
LRELLAYDTETGVFTWRAARGGKLPGDVAGSVCRARGKDYIRIRLDDELIMAHRLAWFYVHGVWPEEELDHDDGDGCNNRLPNLKPANRLQNNKNASLRRDNQTGVPNVIKARNGRFEARVRHLGVIEYLGTFDTVEEATAVKKAAEKRCNFHPNHGKTKKEAA